MGITSTSPRIKRWFYTHYLNYDKVEVWQTDHYSPDQGYETERQATEAAISSLHEKLDSLRSTISHSSQTLIKLTEQQAKLLRQLSEIK